MLDRLIELSVEHPRITCALLCGYILMLGQFLGGPM